MEDRISHAVGADLRVRPCHITSSMHWERKEGAKKRNLYYWDLYLI